MPKLWLTYAWIDNEEADVDFVAQELERRGIEVRLDRVRLLAGHPLWDSIAAEIADPELDGWAIFVTLASLQSGPCQEELRYALDRALAARGAPFPLIGIFPEDVDRALIPAAIRVRKYVPTSAPDWADQVLRALERRPGQVRVDVDPFGSRVVSQPDGSMVIEAWPRAGSWFPATFGVLQAEAHLLDRFGIGARGTGFHGGPQMGVAVGPSACGRFELHSLQQQATPALSLFAYLRARPTEFVFGPDPSTGLWHVAQPL